MGRSQKVFFGTPHRGADSAKWLGIIANMASAAYGRSSSKFVPMLRTYSEDLLKISDDFRPWAQKYAIVSFYEENVHPVLGSVVSSAHLHPFFFPFLFHTPNTRADEEPLTLLHIV